MAHRKALGTTCTITYDTDETVALGDVIRTAVGTCYRVIEARQQERGVHAGRWHLTCIRISGGDVEADDMVHPLYWYSRNKGENRHRG